MDIIVIVSAAIVVAAVLSPILYLAFFWKQPAKQKKKWKQCKACKKWSETT